jgi:uncharacterized membrane protein YhhN
MRLSVRALALGVSAAASLAYLLLARWMPLPADAVAKGLAVTMLGILALHERKSFLAAALLLSSLGDVLLEAGRSYFLLGLAAFLTSHLIYVTLFVRHRAQVNPAAKQMAWSAVLAAYGIGFGVWLGPSLGEMRTPVFCYIAALVAMVATASRANYRSRRVFLGALLFLISDSLLGTDKFKLQIPWSGFLVWTTYYLGQCGIALGVMNEPAPAGAMATEPRA